MFRLCSNPFKIALCYVFTGLVAECEEGSVLYLLAASFTEKFTNLRVSISVGMIIRVCGQ